MKRLTILVDMDGVLEDLSEAWIEWLNERYEYNVKKKDVITWNVDTYFPTLTHREIREPLLIDDFWLTVKPFEDAITYLKKIIDLDHKVYICTNTHYYTARSKFDNVLFRYFPYLHWTQIITCNDKQMIKGDVLIDDNPNNLIGGEYRGILFSQHHNLYFDESKHNNICRCNNWSEIYYKIKELSE